MSKRSGSALLEAIIALALLVVLMPAIFNFVLVDIGSGISDGLSTAHFRDAVLRHGVEVSDHTYIGDQVIRHASGTDGIRKFVPRGGAVSWCNLRPRPDPQKIALVQTIQTYYSPSNPITDMYITADNILFAAFDGNQQPSFDLYLHLPFPGHYEVGYAINTGPGIRRFAVDEKNSQIYAASTGSQYQLQLISWADGWLIFNKNIQIATTTGMTGQAVAIDADRNLLAVGMSKNTGPELYILDIASRTAPIVRDTFEANTQINDLIFRDGWLYVATPGQPQVHRMNISAAGTVSAYQSVTFSGDQVQDASRLVFTGDSLWVLRTVGGFNVVANPELVHLKINDPADFSIVSQQDVGASLNGFAYFDSVLMSAIGESRRRFLVEGYGKKSESEYVGMVPAALVCSEEKIFVAFNPRESNSMSHISIYTFISPYVP